jgi:hypothetical protein
MKIHHWFKLTPRRGEAPIGGVALEIEKEPAAPHDRALVW